MHLSPSNALLPEQARESVVLLEATLDPAIRRPLLQAPDALRGNVLGHMCYLPASTEDTCKHVFLPLQGVGSL